MKIALIKGIKGAEGVGSGANYIMVRLFELLKEEHKVDLIYGNNLPFLPETLKVLPFGRVRGYDIVHSMVPEFLAFISSDAPILTTFCDDIMCKPEIYLRGVDKITEKLKIRANKETLKFLIKKGLRKCKKIIAISEDAKRGAIKSFNVPENKIVIIPPGIDTDAFKPLKIQKKDGIKLKLFFCGGIGKRKGVDVLLESLKILKKKIPVELWLAGALHPLFPLDKILKELNLKDEVKYFGFVSNERLNQLYNKADIFVFPSAGEGYGISPIEALYCGTKVVCSNNVPSVEPFREFVTITKTDPQSIAEGVLGAINKEVDFELARRKIEKDYSAKVVAEKHIRLYKQVIAGEINERKKI